MLDQDRIWVTRDAEVLLLDEMPVAHLLAVEAMLAGRSRALHLDAMVDALSLVLAREPGAPATADTAMGSSIADLAPEEWLATTALWRGIQRTLRARGHDAGGVRSPFLVKVVPGSADGAYGGAGLVPTATTSGMMQDVTTLEDILDQLYLAATDERDKCDRFERLMLQFFRTDLQWADRFSDVWLWSEWPDRHGKPDTGIDLVAKDTTTGDTVAIQCKFYDPAHYLSKADIDSFLATSGKHPFGQWLIVSTTDKWGKNAEDTIENQQVPVQRLRFMDLAESSIDWSQFDLSTPQVMALKERKRLRPGGTPARSRRG